MGRSFLRDGPCWRCKRTLPRLYFQPLGQKPGACGGCRSHQFSLGGQRRWWRRPPPRTSPATTSRSSAIGRIIQDGPDRVVQFGGAQLVDTQRHPGPSVGDLPGDDRLVVPHRRDDQRQAIGERLAHGVLARRGTTTAAMCGSRASCGTCPANRMCGGACSPGGAASTAWSSPPRSARASITVRKKPRSGRAAESPQRHQQVPTRGIEPIPRERRFAVGAAGQRWPGEHVPGAEAPGLPDQGRRREHQHEPVGEPQVGRVADAAGQLETRSSGHGPTPRPAACPAAAAARPACWPKSPTPPRPAGRRPPRRWPAGRPRPRGARIARPRRSRRAASRGLAA